MNLNTVILILGTLFAAVQSAIVLKGFMRRSSDDNCLRNAGGAALMVPVSSGVNFDCTLVTVSGDAGDGFTIAAFADTGLKLSDTADTTGLTIATGLTSFKFVDGSNNPVCGAGLVASGNGFLIDVKDGTQTGSACVKNDMTYANTADATTCDDMLFYFETIDCSSIPDCTLCYEDSVFKCSSCGNNKKPNADKTTCEACTNDEVGDACGMTCTDCDTAMTGCTTCTAHDACTACTADTKALNENDSGCIDCGLAIPDCTTCASANGANTCSACGNSKVPDDSNESCVSCPASQVPNADGTACEDCPDLKVPNADGNACEACPDSQVPNADGTSCEAGPDSQVPNADGTSCEDPADSGSNVILPMSLGAVLLLAALGKIISA